MAAVAVLYLLAVSQNFFVMDMLGALGAALGWPSWSRTRTRSADSAMSCPPTGPSPDDIHCRHKTCHDTNYCSMLLPCQMQISDKFTYQGI